MADKRKELAVIGAGPGGYTAAFMAADLGMSVTVINMDKNPGGVCLYRGCIPTKALISAVKTKQDFQKAEKMGLSAKDITVDTDKLFDWKDSVVKKLTGGLGQLVKQRKIDYIQGRAEFVSSRKLRITKEEGGEEEKEFDEIIISTGTYPFFIPNLDSGSDRVVTPEESLDMRDIPDRLLVVGAGYIGLEMSSVFHGLGSKVTIVEMLPEIMTGADRDVLKIFKKQNKDLFENIYVNTVIKESRENKDGITVSYENSEGDDPGDETFDAILLAAGRRPNSEKIGLENTGVETDDKGFIKVDEQRRTADEHIWAVGDITGGPLLAHKASHEGKVAAEAAAGKKTVYDPAAVPSVEYTDPEIAWTGLTEKKAEEEGRNVQVASFPWGASGRAATLGRNDGVTKLIIDPETERILGCSIVGKDAGELISEGTLAIEMAALASDVAWTIHPHPTLSETLMEAAEAFYGTSTSVYKPKKRE
ncbi:MAG: dihydrolipoyl dehydrogenase [Spirochaetia bacterium]